MRVLTAGLRRGEGNGWRRICAALGVIATWFALTTAACAETQERRYNFNIREETLGAALDAMVEKTDYIVLYPYELASRRDVNPVIGQYTVGQAIEELFRGTEFSGGLTESGVIAISISGGKTNEREGEVAKGKLKKSLLAGVATFLFGAGAHAQDVDINEEAEAEAERDQIIVTGTNLKNAELSSSPRLEYDRNDIEATGALTTEGFLRTVPQLFSGGRNGLAEPASESFDNVANNSRITTANLRGLAVGATLSLVNGRRMAPVGTGGDFDISMIPIGAIERVEIVPDGASAIYGSDAIAGVVNFVLRRDFEGAESSIDYQFDEDSGYDLFTANQTFGVRWGTGGLLASYDYSERSALRSSDRTYSSPTFPLTLVDPQERHGLLLSLDQDLGSAARFKIDGLYSMRDGSSMRAAAPDYTNDYEIDYYTISPTLTVEISDQWEVELAGVIGGAEEDNLSDIGGSVIESSVRNTFQSVDAVVRGRAFDLPTGAVEIAAGLTGRWEDQTRINPAGEADADRRLYAAFAEALIPFASPEAPLLGFEGADLSLAVRYEDYSDIGSTVNPKFGLSLTPFEGLNLRGSYSTSFKAPIQSIDAGTEFLVATFQPDPTTGGLPLTLVYGGVVQDIGPEEAESFTFGFDWQPPQIDSLTLNLTYYDITFDGRIASPAPNVVTFLSQPDVYGAFLDFDPDPASIDNLLNSVPRLINLVGPFPPDAVDVLVDFRIRNIAVTETSGFDINFGYGHEAFGGRLRGDLNVNYIMDFSNQTLPGGPVSDDLDILYRPLEFRARGRLSWTRGGFTGGVAVNYADDYRNITTTPSEPVEDYTTIDLDLRYDLSANAGADSLLNGFVLSVNVRNLFDEDPPFVSTPQNGNFYDGANADPLGRIIGFGLTKRW